MENMIIRKATLNDLYDIQLLNNQLFKLEKENFDPTLVENWPITEEGEKYFKILIEESYVIVAILNDKIVGYLAGSINEKGSYEEIQYGEINNMFINDDYRGYGIGKLLINDFKKYCISNDIKDLIVTASAKNMNAIEFYRKNGFNDFNITLTMNIKE
ncbi:MAG: GNAT family N-acetyltransferase [Firmicutes bacterium]|nr:GNAT family N-acetyltransferase [Bacillota bacterium]